MAGAVWTVRRRNVVYPIHQTVSILYLRLATLRFYYCRWSEKYSLYHIIDVLYLLSPIALRCCLHPQAYVVMIFAFVIGFSSAGGVVQIGLTLMAARFPQEKVKRPAFITRRRYRDVHYSVDRSAVSEMALHILCGFDTGIAAAGFLLALFIGYRSRAESQRITLRAASTAQ